MKQLPQTHFIDLGELRLPIRIKRLHNSRRMVVRYQPLRQHVTLTLPQRASLTQGLHFINEKREWILRQVKQHSSTAAFTDGQEIPVLGKNIRLQHIGGRGTQNEQAGILQVHGGKEFMERRVRAWLVSKVKTEITALVEIYAAKIGVKAGNITLRDTSSRWGSCSSSGNLSFSWRLVFAPYEVLAYIVAHEVAHIREHNHSPAFWQLVRNICPQYAIYRNWLKENGSSLYIYGA